MLFLTILLSFLCAVKGQNLQWTHNNYTTHECLRTCNGVPKRCYYKFTVEDWFTNTPNCMSCMNGTESNCNNPECTPLDGRRNLIVTYNRMYPGPCIQVCEGDEIMVDVVNEMLHVTTTTHWHGMHQLESPWMDGVPMITQCPIQPHTTFRYHFKARQAGTHWYHSHSAYQRNEGLFGCLVVRQTRAANFHRDLYDTDLAEHTILINDIYNRTPQYHFYSNLREKGFNFGLIIGIAINGRATTDENRVPPRRFMVQSGRRHRFRITHAGGEPCDFTFEIEKHQLQVISSDGHDLKPFTVNKLVLTGGERYDVIVVANQAVNSYVIRVTGGLICDNRRGYAVLQYVGAPIRNMNYSSVSFDNPNAMVANCVNQPLNNKCYNYVNMTAMETMPTRLKQAPDFKAFLGFDIYEYAKPSYRGVGDEELTQPFINNISMTSPTRPLLLNHPDSTQNFCNEDFMQPRFCDGQFCECVHLVQIQVNSTFEIIYYDEAQLITMTHPMHLHGYACWIVGQGKLGETTTRRRVIDLDRAGLLPRNFNNPPIKDTVQVPSGGYTIMRCLANNPGYWLMHCHVDFHADEGMMMVFLVDNFDRSCIFAPKDMPNCGNYLKNNTFFSPTCAFRQNIF